jgi:hypothetical protein
MEPEEQKSDGIKEKVFLWAYVCIFALGIIVLATVSEDYKELRIASGFLVYGTGLPLLVIRSLYYSHKKGWLKLNDTHNR